MTSVRSLSSLRSYFPIYTLVAIAALVYCCLTPFAFAQQTLGAITGTVTDPS